MRNFISAEKTAFIGMFFLQPTTHHDMYAFSWHRRNDIATNCSCKLKRHHKRCLVDNLISHFPYPKSYITCINFTIKLSTACSSRPASIFLISKTRDPVMVAVHWFPMQLWDSSVELFCSKCISNQCNFLPFWRTTLLCEFSEGRLPFLGGGHIQEGLLYP